MNDMGPSPFATSMFLIVPPPLGIGQACIFFVDGTNRTSMLCASSPDSAYQTAASDVTATA